MNRLITGDWHISGKMPPARKDPDWMETQIKTIQFVLDTAKKHNACIDVTGDLFDSHTQKNEIILMMHSMFKKVSTLLYCIPGNHDTQYGQIKHTAYHMLSALFDGDFVVTLAMECNDSPFSFLIEKKTCQYMHTLIGYGHYPGMKDPISVLKEYPDTDYIFTGDNHLPFYAKHEGRMLVNPGCLIRRKASEREYKSCVFLLNIETGSIEKINVPEFGEMKEAGEFSKQAPADAHNFSSFLEKLNSKEEHNLSFKEEIEKDQHQLPPEVREVINTYFEEL